MEEDIHDDDHDPFPTLKSALERLASHVGFNVEIKWTMQLKVSKLNNCTLNM